MAKSIQSIQIQNLFENIPFLPVYKFIVVTNVGTDMATLVEAKEYFWNEKEPATCCSFHYVVMQCAVYTSHYRRGRVV